MTEESGNTQVKRTPYILFVFFFILIVIVLGFTGILNILDFQQNYTESLISSYEVSGRESVRKIEYALRYGKPLENFYGIEEVLAKVKDDIPDVENVRVISDGGRVMYDLQGAVEGADLPPELQNIFSFSSDEDERNFRYGTFNDDYHLFLPIRDRDFNWQGSMQIIFPVEIITSRTAYYSGKLLIYLGIMALAGMFVLILISRLILFFNADGSLKRKTFLLVSLLLLGMIQVVFGWLNYNIFKDGYMEVAQNNASLLSNIIRTDIESVVEKGVSYDKLYRLEDYLIRISESVPEIDWIQLSSEDGEITYSTKEFGDNEMEGETLDVLPDPSMLYSHSLVEDNDNIGADMQLVLSEDYFNQRMQTILLDSLTMLVLSLILMIEIVIFMMIILQWQYEKRYRLQDNMSNKTRPATGVTIVRTLALMIGASVFMSASFIPLRMKELYEPLWGLSESLVLGLPISVEMLFAAICAFLAGKIIDKKGWRFVIFIGLTVFAVGLFLSYYASQASLFILARAFSGAGYGFVLLSIRSFVNERPTNEERTKGFSSYVSGLYAGFIIGVVIGAMLADRIGFAQVFLVSLLVCILAAPFTLFFLKKPEQIHGNNEPHETINDSPSPDYEKKSGGALSFLGNSKVFGFFLLIILPLTICSMFVDYFFPIFASSQGVSTSDIGRAFMLNGIAIAYLGPYLSNYMQRRVGTKNSIFVSGLIISGALLLFYVFNNVQAAYLVVILMGVSESFGLTAQNNYFIGLKATKMFGQGSAMGFAENIRKMGQMMGPIVFGSTIALGSLGIGLIGLVTLIVTALFLFGSRTTSSKRDHQIPSSPLDG